VQNERAPRTIEELAEHVGVPVRTVRFYITEGIVPGPNARGRAATYGEEHLLRLRLARELAEQRVPLAEIRERMARLSSADLRAVLADAQRDTAALSRKAQEPSPKAYLSALLQRSRAARQAQVNEASSPYVHADRAPVSAYPPAMAQRIPVTPGQVSDAPPPPAEPWERWHLAPGVELHVHEGAREKQRALIDRLLRAARPVRDANN
jgi:DNA-binding transcriptional MerR regulator